LIGYDTFNYILHHLKNLQGPISRDEFVDLLDTKTKFNGVYRNFNLNENNTNKKVQIVKYKYGQFLPLN